MSTFDRHSWVIALLKQARRPSAEVTLAHLEENLRWLVQMAVPDVPASALLRQRVRALGGEASFWQRWWPIRFRGEGPAGRLASASTEWPAPARREELFSEQEQQTLRLLLTADVRQLPEDARLHSDAREVMRELLARLPEPQREALLLQVRHGLTLPEIAQILGHSEAETRELLQQARAAIFQYGSTHFEA
jgi:RNA polymerase sigma factor (sigma-70 family)